MEIDPLEVRLVPATLFWDANATAADGANGGSGTWNPAAATTNFYNPATGADAAWTNGNNIAYFGMGGGLVSIPTATNVTAGGLILDTTTNNGGVTGIAPATAGDATSILTLVGPATINTVQPLGVAFGTVNENNISAVVAGSSGLSLSGTGSLILSNVGNTFTGGITINGGVLKVSNVGNLGDSPGTPNTVTLNNGGVNSYGGLYVTTGFTDAGNITTGASGGTLDVANGQTLSLTGNLSTGTGSLTKTDRGTLVVATDDSGQTFAGGITVAGGQLKGINFTGAANSLGASSTAITLNGPGSVYAQASGVATPGTLGTLTAGGGSMLAVDSSATPSNTISLAFSQLARGGNGTLVVDAVQNKLGTGEQVALGTAPTVTNGIIAPWAIATSGTATNANGNFLNYSGGTLVPATYTSSGGNVLAGATPDTSVVQVTGTDNSLAASQGIYALADNGQAITASANGPVTLTISSGGLILNGGNIGSATAANQVNVNFGTAQGDIFVNSSGGTISNVLSGSGGIVKFGSNGTLTLGFSSTAVTGDSTPNSYTGTFQVNGGTVVLNEIAGTSVITGDLVIGPGAALGSATGVTGIVQLNADNLIAPTSNITVNDGGVLNLNGHTLAANSLTLNGSGNVTNGTLILNGTVTVFSGSTNPSNLGATGKTGDNQTVAIQAQINSIFNLGGATRTITVNASGANSASIAGNPDLAIDGVITNGGIIKAGSGILSLNAANTFTGGISIVGGTLRVLGNTPINTNGALGNSNLPVVLGDPTGSNNATLQLGGQTNVFGHNLIVVASTSPTPGTATLSTINSGNNSGSTFNGNITLGRTLTIAPFESTGSGPLVINGILTGPGGITYNPAALGTNLALPLNNAGNNYSGTTTVLAGSINPGNYGLSATSPLVIDKSASGNGQVDLASNSVQVSSLADGTVVGPGTLQSSGNHGGILVLGNSTGAAGTIFSGSIPSSLSIVKIGSSTQVLDNNTGSFTGNPNLVVDGGKLQLGGTGGGIGSGTITVQAGGNLAIDSTASTGSITRSTGTVTDGGGAISVAGSAISNTADVFTGGFTLQGGEARISVTPGAATQTTASFGAFTRTAGGTVVFSGANLGSLSTSTDTAQIKFSSSPATISNLGSTSVNILPWAAGDSTAGGTGTGFVTYDSNGVRLLTPSEYALDSLAAGQNVQLTASNSNASSLAVQSLFLNGAGITLSGSSPLTVDQNVTGGAGGAILNIGANGSNANTISAPLVFNHEAIVDAVNDLNLLSTLTLNNQAFTKTGPGTLTLGGSTTLSTSAAVTIDNGTLKLGAANSLNGTSGNQVNLNGGGVLDLNGFSQTINNLSSFGQNANNGIGSASSNGGAVTNNGPASATLTLSGGTSNTFYGSIQNGTSPINVVKNGTTTQTIWSNNPTDLSYTGGTTINGGTLQYRLNQSTAANVSIGASSSPVLLNGGTLEFDQSQFNGGLVGATTIGTTAFGSVNFTNPVTVTSAGGGLVGDNSVTNQAAKFTGPIALGGVLSINGEGGVSGGVGLDVNGAATAFDRYVGPIALNQSTAGQLGITYVGAHDGNTNTTASSSLDSAITDGAGGAQNPLFLKGSSFSYNTTGGTGDIFNITGASTFSGGTIVRESPQLINLTAAGQTVGTTETTTADATLGTGNVFLDPGAMLRLNAAANVNTSGGAVITAAGDQLNLPVVDVAYNPASQASLGISSSSTGVLGIDAALFATALDESTLGNGKMSLGAVGTTGTYAGATLGVGAAAPTPGTGVAAPTYRLGGGNGTLAIANDVLLGAANLVVNQVGGRDANDDFTGIVNGQGTVKLNAPQGLTGTVTINGGANDNNLNDSILQLAVTGANGSAQPLGTGSNTVVLNGGNLQFVMPAAASARTDLSIGDLDLDGGPSILSTNNTNTGSAVTIGGPGGIVRTNDSSLIISAPNLANIGVGGTEFKVANNVGDFVPAGSASTGIATVGGAVAPWITYAAQNNGAPTFGNVSFLAYNAATGFTPTTYTINNGATAGAGTSVATAGVDGTTNKLSSEGPSDIVSVIGNDSSLTASENIYALRGGKNFSITTTNNAGIQLGITSGGLIADAQNGAFSIGSVADPIGVYFGDAVNQVPTEAVIWGGYFNGATNINLPNQVIAAGITMTGYGNLNLQNPGTQGNSPANIITGPITIDGGSVTTGNVAGTGESALGTGNNVIVNGGTWDAFNDVSTTLTHNIEVGSAGGGFQLGNASKSYSGSITDLSTIPTGVFAGPLTLTVGGNTLTLTNTDPAANLWSGGTEISGSTGKVIVQSGVNFGTGDVSVLAEQNRNIPTAGNVVFQGDSNMAPTAKLNVWSGATASFTSGGPSIGGLEGSGNVVLGNAGGSTNLTIGGGILNGVTANGSTEFDGNITQANGANGGLTKAGTGTLTLAGIDAYTGTTTVNAGTLIVNGTDSTGVVFVNAGTLGGIGVITGSVIMSSGTQLSPGNAGATGILTTGDLNLASGVTLNAQINGGGAGTGYDQVVSTGSVNLNDATLNLSLGSFTPGVNEVFVLVNNQGGGSVNGFFDDAAGARIADGSTITLGGKNFRIFYGGGDGNDVVLVENSQPTIAYVSQNFFGAGSPNIGQSVDGDQGTAGVQTAVFGVNAFTSIAPALAAVTSSGTVVVNNAAYSESPSLTGTMTLQLAGNVQLDSLDSSAGATVDLGSNLLVTGDGAGNNTLAGPVVGIGGSLEKVGSDTLTLSGTDTYTGGTTVASGTLLVDGSTSPASTVTVASGATLGGTGTIAGTIQAQPGAIVAPGDAPGSVGTLTTGPVTFGSGILSLDLTSALAFDSVSATVANLTGATLSLAIGTIHDNDQFTILKLSGTSGGLTGTFNGLPNNNSTIAIGSRTFSINYTGGDGNDVVLTALPASGTPSVFSTVLNGGIPYVNSSLATKQHSMVENIVYSFTEPVSLSAANFTLTGINGTTTAPNVVVSGSGTVWTVTFAGAGVNDGTHSIGDGEYRLVLSGVPGLVSNTFDFFRLLGDMDGDGTVSASDFSTLISTFLRPTTDPLYLGADDFDGDGTIGASDVSQFTANFLHTVPAPLPN